MTPTLKLVAFAAALALLLSVGLAAGAIVDPPNRGLAPEAHDHMSGHMEMTPGGLAIADDRFRLEVAPARFSVGSPTELRFAIKDNDGRTLRDFDVEQARRLHLIVVRQDLTGYQHVHPVMAPDGTWSIPLTLSAPGPYRLYADFTTHGERHTLGFAVLVSGAFVAAPLPAPEPYALSDGNLVTVQSAQADEEARLVLTVRDRVTGRPVDDLQPYLGALGHLVALRQGDLAYLHVHPDLQASDARHGRIVFNVAFPSAGMYRLFLQFRRDGAVHTAAFTYRAGMA
jgi:hypothetical protein